MCIRDSVNDAPDFAERAASAFEVGKLSGQVVVALTQALVFFGGIRVDGAHVRDAAAQLERLVFHRSPILQGRQIERMVERRLAVVDDGVHRGLYLHFQAPLVDAGLTLSLIHI